jgi:hypothetical protein
MHHAEPLVGDDSEEFQEERVRLEDALVLGVAVFRDELVVNRGRVGRVRELPLGVLRLLIGLEQDE